MTLPQGLRDPDQAVKEQQHTLCLNQCQFARFESIRSKLTFKAAKEIDIAVEGQALTQAR